MPRHRSCRRVALAGLPLLLAVIGLTGGPLRAEPPSFFEQRVAPVLKQRCVRCHNPRQSRGGLDLTTRAMLLQGGEQGPAVVPGKAGDSLLVEMVGGTAPEMPQKGEPLTAKELADLRRWIDDGAAWPVTVKLTDADAKPVVGADWWSLRPLARPPLPAVEGAARVRTPVDRFVLATLAAKGLRPSAPADRRTLLRRVTFDLHGLPPTPEEVEAFVADPAADAYEKLVERLLASPRYGERWGRHWLDVAHYGDTHGYDKDKRRDHAWPYRDYVIRSFNADKPYARFVAEQVAGDVLYPDDPDGIVATGFIAAGPWDFVGHVELREGTVDKEKTRLLDRDDMVSTTIGTFNSLTAHCARCHDHKFDPIPQRDYYRLQAVFAGVDRGDRPFEDRRSRERRDDLARRRKEAETRRAALLAKANALSNPELVRLDADLKALRGRLAALPPMAGAPSPSNGYHSGIAPVPGVRKWVQADLGRTVPVEVVRLIPARPTDFPDTPGFGFPVRFRVELSDDPTFARAEVVADHTREDFTNPGDRPVEFRPAGRKARYVRVTAERLWRRTGDYVFALAELQVESGGTNVARGATVSALDSIEAGRWSRKYLVDDFDSRRALPDRSDPKTAGTLKQRAAIQDEIRRAEKARQAKADTLVPADLRAELAKATAAVAALDREARALPPAGLVYAVRPRSPRPIHRLHRGEVEQPRESAVPGALACVPGQESVFRLTDPTNEGQRRAALAEWLACPKNVLTWRSMANRVWHYHFGRGIVETPSDFGGNGSQPTHPELLDWLACELRDNGGSIKKLHRLIVLSATYTQASINDPANAKLDADNCYLWRMNRQRLDAESVRDSVLAVSGKLDLTMGGAGFELFRFKDDHSPVYDHTALEKIHDPATYRRTVYRFTVRSVPNPFLDCLDSADPNLNTPVRNTTLTALQALAMLNDPFVVRQAEYFAERVKKRGPDVLRQIESAYRLAFGRPPSAAERDALAGYATKHGLASACRLLFNANEFTFVD